MDIVFERGSRERPRGHALLYFRSASEPDFVWVTYVVILPISVDVSKYVPPFLLNQMGELGPKDLSAFAFPPAPEKQESYAVLEDLATKRDDDILYAGSIEAADVSSSVMKTGEAVQRYAEMYSSVAGDVAETRQCEAAKSEGLGVREVLYDLMSEEDKLGELTKMVGRLKFAFEGSDEAMIGEAEEDIHVLASHLPESHEIARLVEAVKSTDQRAADLAELYLQRCYHLVREDYADLGKVEERIREIEDCGAPGSREGFQRS